MNRVDDRPNIRQIQARIQVEISDEIRLWLRILFVAVARPAAKSDRDAYTSVVDFPVSRQLIRHAQHKRPALRIDTWAIILASFGVGNDQHAERTLCGRKIAIPVVGLHRFLASGPMLRPGRSQPRAALDQPHSHLPETR